MHTFHVMTNADKDRDCAVTKRICSYLEKKGCKCSFEVLKKDMSEAVFQDRTGIDCVIVSGGDGTMIQAADLVAGSDPMVGVNLGTLGFLEEIEVERLEEMLDRLVSDDYEIEERMMLSGFRTKEQPYHALNDIVISRSGSLRVLNLEIYVNDLLLGIYTADGMIVSTPTGSTAYNLSAGGPIVEPDAAAILLTPICTHNLNSRAVVLSADDVVHIRIGENEYESEAIAAASFDGCRQIKLKPADSITIRRAPIVTKLIRLNRESFLKTLSKKFAEGRA